MRVQSKVRLHRWMTCLPAFIILATATAGVVRADDDPWPSIQKELFGTRSIVENDNFVQVDAPDRAEDAAVVPITIRVPPTVKGQLKSMVLVIDKNPAPVAATLTFGSAAGDVGERRFSTRVRVDTYSHVRAIVETSDGVLHMTKAFVKASGGCSAPAPKDSEAEQVDLGRTIVKSFGPAPGTTALGEAQIMIKHPNNSGMQLDQISRGYIPARFVRDVTVTRGNDLVFKMEAGISVSTNPYFRFTYAAAASGSNVLDVVAIDSDETKFSGRTNVASQ